MTIDLPVSSSNAIRWRLALELELDPAVDDPLAPHPPADAGLVEEVDHALLEHARADARLDVLAAPVLEHDRLDPLAMEQLRERESRRARADDPDLRAGHARPSSSSTCCAIANAEFAAGTPQ